MRRTLAAGVAWRVSSRKKSSPRANRKENRVVALHFRKRKDFHHSPGHNAKPALRTPKSQRRASLPTDSRGRHRAARKTALRRHHIHIEHQIFNVAVAILLHAAGVGGNPAAQCGELNAVGLVPQSEARARRAAPAMRRPTAPA